MKKTIVVILAITSFVFLSWKVSTPADSSIGATHTLEQFKNGMDNFVLSNEQLHSAVGNLNPDSATIAEARKALVECRLSYKRIAFLTSYFFPSETRFYNAAPKFEVEEPTLELVEPMGLQQIETLLFDDDVLAQKADLLVQSEAMLSSAGDMHALLFGIQITDAQVLESVRIELIRMSALYISGYDAPMLKSGIAETLEATNAIRDVLQPYFATHPEQSRSFEILLANSQNYLKAHPHFDSFDRMAYLRRFALPMQKEFRDFVAALGMVINTTKYLNYEAPYIYSKDALKGWENDSIAPPRQKALAEMGRILFFDKSLSGDASTSCATCHQPQNYFTDQLKKSPSLVRDSVLKRNTPTLLYAGWQHTQFWDGRVASLKDQIHNVIFNPLEMNGNEASLNRNVLLSDKYRTLIKASFLDKNLRECGIGEVSEALTVFLKQLSPMNSPFDRYIDGEQTALTDRQVNGFNLFMGKAQCGTCHFPPFFNSLLPPLFEISEVEVLGVTTTDDFENPQLDPDSGRFDLYKMKYYKGAFKTPTVRNAAQTGPYMHNGSFNSLAKVVDFYNKAGGRGLSLSVEEQTLSATPLNLSDHEAEDIILFLESLTDSNIEKLTFSN
ncbi:cytochrome-c peroxidase [Dyadobacter sp. MSC1_007]|jgi:cytochrome c peroxidase|uniref:cytochrome-c peroxidase n=1 Tax=Dyadobacter sp. MSC1_007 TaxID=2909264 RepID=UPI00202EF240|nr:cytochrome c peroxidase [Dyadobacter sp. MSC1_007]